MGWSVGRALVVAGILGVIVLTVIGLIDLTSDNKSLAYINESSNTRNILRFKWIVICFGVALMGFFIALSFSWSIGSVVFLVAFLLTICLILVAIKDS